MIIRNSPRVLFCYFFVALLSGFDQVSFIIAAGGEGERQGQEGTKEEGVEDEERPVFNRSLSARTSQGEGEERPRCNHHSQEITFRFQTKCNFEQEFPRPRRQEGVHRGLPQPGEGQEGVGVR